MIKQIVAGLSVLTLAASANASLITNGDFEDGLNGWGATNTFGEGSVSIIEDSRDSNNHIARLNDPSSFGGELLWQTFYVPTDINKITVSFDYKFEEEDTSWFFTDRAAAHLLKLDENTFLAVDDLFHTTRDSNGWVSVSIVIDTASIYDHNPNAMIQFGIWESFSENTDSSLFVDNISIVDTYASVPEPSSLMLLGLGLAGFAVSRKKKP